MSRLREVHVHTSVTTLPSLLDENATIPIHNDLELSKYTLDCHIMLFKLLQAENVGNPSTRSRFLHVSRGKLRMLHAAWENYLFDYRDSLMKDIVIGKRSVTLYTLFWRNFCVLNSLLMKRHFKDKFQFQSARDMSYVRRNLLCVSSKPIGEYSMSEILCAMRVLSVRKWELYWDSSYIDYLLQLEFVASQRVSYLGGEEDKCLYNEGCSRARDTPDYGVTMETCAQMASWFHAQKQRTRQRQMVEQWVCTEALPIDPQVVQNLQTILYQHAQEVRDVSLFLKDMKRFILDSCIREGDVERYRQANGTIGGSAKDILRELRPVNYIAYREDDLFDVKSVSQLLDSTLVSMKPYQELVYLYLLNHLFNITPGCRFKWLRFYVFFELEFEGSYAKMKCSDQPILLQSFRQWFVYYQAHVWPMPDLLHAFIGWAGLLREKCQNLLHHSVDMSPLSDQIVVHSQDEEESEEKPTNSHRMDLEGLSFHDASSWL